MLIFIFILSTLCFALIGTYRLKKQQQVKRRIQQLILKDTKKSDVNVEKEPKDQQKSPFKELIKTLSKNIKTSNHKRYKLENELESAGLPLKVEEFISIRLGLFGLTLIGTLLLKFHILIAIIAALTVWVLPSIVLRQKKAARIAVSAAQLPQVLETMASGMKSGFSFMQAMQLVSKEMPDPIGTEFQKTIKEINLGIPLENAFENLLHRLPNKDLEIVVTAVLIQRSTGGNLVTILETIHDTISERVRMKDELKALTSQGRMSALVITLLPVALGLLLNVMNPDYFDPMLSHPLGWVLLGAGSISAILGWFFIQKVVTIEV
ncbi:type II secretion system F family protein [Bacillus sp. Marseille-P3661]|uniref:type II secretion system F family protein n=1 Tax=Bacillus sp. Marseille-P3661 TaxID=1936234 RepID=UPI0015E1980C|nr:type II secretion system F family protein [Bacillus sp. Marseille-P3661]